MLRKLFVAAVIVTALVGCGGSDVHEKPHVPKCPPPPEPAHVSAVVGTIGKMHMVESRYGLNRLGEVIAAFKPDLILLGVRVDAFRDDKLEDASFEMTYVHHLAKTQGIVEEPIDWFREADLVAPPTPVEPYDVAEIEKRESEVLRAPRQYTFDQANGGELAEKVLLAQAAEARYRSGDPLNTKRRGWISHLVADAITRHGRPKRVLAFVDVLDRPVADLTLRGVGYDDRSPVDIVAKAKEVPASADLPSEVLASWTTQLGRVKDRAAQAKEPAEKTFWEERLRVLSAVVEKKAACCVTQSSLNAK